MSMLLGYTRLTARVTAHTHACIYAMCTYVQAGGYILRVERGGVNRRSPIGTFVLLLATLSLVRCPCPCLCRLYGGCFFVQNAVGLPLGSHFSLQLRHFLRTQPRPHLSAPALTTPTTPTTAHGGANRSDTDGCLLKQRQHAAVGVRGASHASCGHTSEQLHRRGHVAGISARRYLT